MLTKLREVYKHLKEAKKAVQRSQKHLTLNMIEQENELALDHLDKAIELIEELGKAEKN